MRLAMEDRPRRHRITVDEYHRMAEDGLIAPKARVELIEGEIVDMAPIGLPHAGIVNQLMKLMVLAIADRAIVQCQGPVQLGDYSEPQPDVAVFTWRDDYYMRQRPMSADALLAVEVSDTTSRYDLGMKMPLYARHEVRELWVFELPRKLLHVFRKPQHGTYADIARTSDRGIVQIEALPGIDIDLSRIVWDD